MLAPSVQNNKGETYSRNLITEEEIAQSQALNILDVISDLRPHMLRSRGSYTAVVVYLDNTKLVGFESLMEIHPSLVKEIRWLNARGATNRFGTGHQGGVLFITMK